MKPRIEYILWKDCVSIDTWTAEADLDGELSVIETIGRFVKETNTTIVVALNFDSSSNDFSCVMNIPKVNVIKRSQLDAISYAGKDFKHAPQSDSVMSIWDCLCRTRSEGNPGL